MVLNRPGLDARHVAAGVFAIAALVLAAWSLRSWFPKNSQSPEPLPVIDPRLALTTELLDTPTTGSPEVAVEAASARLHHLLRDHTWSSLPGKNDLVSAFTERLRSTVDGDYVRDTLAKFARGRPPIQLPPPQDHLDFWRQSADRTRGAMIGVARLELRRLSLDASTGLASLDNEGYGTTTFTSSEFKESLPNADRLRWVLEVRLPIAIEPVEGAYDGSVLVGYRFAWNPSRSQWIPYQNCIYKVPGATYAGLPF